MDPEQSLFPFDTSEVDKQLRSWLVDEADFLQTLCAATPMGVQHYTAHSLKRGAIQHVMGQAVARLQRQDVIQFTPEMIRYLAKHEGKTGQVLPTTTVRYITDKVLVARMTKTFAMTETL